MTETVFLALQDVDESRSIIEAVKMDNPEAVVEHHPAMIRISAQGELVIKKTTVEELTGTNWTPQDIQLILVSFGGNLDEDDEYFRIFWS